jgi:hypothetical protein
VGAVASKGLDRKKKLKKALSNIRSEESCFQGQMGNEKI